MDGGEARASPVGLVLAGAAFLRGIGPGLLRIGPSNPLERSVQWFGNLAFGAGLALGGGSLGATPARGRSGRAGSEAAPPPAGTVGR